MKIQNTVLFSQVRMWKYNACVFFRLENKYMYVCHAEMNAILNKNAARNVEFFYMKSYIVY